MLEMTIGRPAGDGLGLERAGLHPASTRRAPRFLRGRAAAFKGSHPGAYALWEGAARPMLIR